MKKQKTLNMYVSSWFFINLTCKTLNAYVWNQSSLRCVFETLSDLVSSELKDYPKVSVLIGAAGLQLHGLEEPGRKIKNPELQKTFFSRLRRQKLKLLASEGTLMTVRIDFSSDLIVLHFWLPQLDLVKKNYCYCDTCIAKDGVNCDRWFP